MSGYPYFVMLKIIAFCGILTCPVSRQYPALPSKSFVLSTEQYEDITPNTWLHPNRQTA
jgi:hypothetical protein